MSAPEGREANLRAQMAADQAKAEQVQTTDSKRSKRSESAQVDADPPVAFAEAQTLRLVNKPGRRASNDGLS
jgi:hypothetical protein